MKRRRGPSRLLTKIQRKIDQINRKFEYFSGANKIIKIGLVILQESQFAILNKAGTEPNFGPQSVDQTQFPQRAISSGGKGQRFESSRARNPNTVFKHTFSFFH